MPWTVYIHTSCLASPLGCQPFFTLQELSEFKSRKKYSFYFFLDTVNITRSAPWDITALSGVQQGSDYVDSITSRPPIKGYRVQQAFAFLIVSVMLNQSLTK